MKQIENKSSRVDSLKHPVGRRISKLIEDNKKLSRD